MAGKVHGRPYEGGGDFSPGPLLCGHAFVRMAAGAFVAAGVRRWGAPLLILLGERWHSVREVLRDIGIAAAFWLVSLGLLFILGRLLRIRRQDKRCASSFRMGWPR